MYKRNQGQFFPLALLMGFAIGYLLLHPVYNLYLVIDESFGDRGGALWLIVSRLPNFLDSSIVFWVLFPIGLACLYIMALHLASRHEYLMIICFSLWLVANMANVRTYQKYYDPFILFSMGYVMVTLKTEGEKYYWVGPVLLLVGFIGTTIVRFFS